MRLKTVVLWMGLAVLACSSPLQAQEAPNYQFEMEYSIHPVYPQKYGQPMGELWITLKGENSSELFLNGHAVVTITCAEWDGPLGFTLQREYVSINLGPHRAFPLFLGPDTSVYKVPIRSDGALTPGEEGLRHNSKYHIRVDIEYSVSGGDMEGNFLGYTYDGFARFEDLFYARLSAEDFRIVSIMDDIGYHNNDIGEAIYDLKNTVQQQSVQIQQLFNERFDEQDQQLKEIRQAVQQCMIYIKYVSIYMRRPFYYLPGKGRR